MAAWGQRVPAVLQDPLRWLLCMAGKQIGGQ